MINSNFSDLHTDFEVREQELREIAAQRQNQLDQMLLHKDRKLKE